MPRLVYSLALMLLTPLLVIYLLLRGRKNPLYFKHWLERFGLKKFTQADIIVHCASMGEAKAAKPVIEHLQQTKPTATIQLTCSSPTGRAFLNDHFPTLPVRYLPFDYSGTMRRFARQSRAQLFIIMEVEIWPNLLHHFKSCGAKVVLLNGRLSNKSMLTYQKHISLFATAMGSFDAICSQTEQEAKRYQQLGVEHSRIHVCGNIKLDAMLSESDTRRGQTFKEQNRRPIWVAGSVHPGEFATVIEAHQQIIKQVPTALLIMVPRHPEKFEEANSALADAELKTHRRSSAGQLELENQVLLGDTMGELMQFYCSADAAFVGGSIVQHGGHSPLEPALVGIPAAMGPDFTNFLELGEKLRDAGHLQIVTDAKQLGDYIIQCFTNPDNAAIAGQSGLDVIRTSRGSTSRQLAVVDTLFID